MLCNCNVDIVDSNNIFHNLFSNGKISGVTTMTLAVADSIMNASGDFSNLKKIMLNEMKYLVCRYPIVDYEDSFRRWINSSGLHNYCGIRKYSVWIVTPCGLFAKSIEQAQFLAEIISKCIRNNLDEINDAKALASSIYLSKVGIPKKEINDYIFNNFYDVNLTFNKVCNKLDNCNKSIVLQALEVLLESRNFYDAIERAICMDNKLKPLIGALAGTYFEVPTDIQIGAVANLNKELFDILIKFEEDYNCKIDKDNLKMVRLNRKERYSIDYSYNLYYQ